MGINFDKALGLHPEALKLRAERTKILAANIANDSTPGYQARDIDFAASLRQVAAEADGAAGAEALLLDSGALDARYRVPYGPTEDGNTVDLGVEQAAFSQNSSDFHTSLTFLNMQLRGLAKAIEGQ